MSKVSKKGKDKSVLTLSTCDKLRQPEVVVDGPSFAKMFAHVSTTTCVQKVMPDKVGECVDNCPECWAGVLLK